MANDETLSHLPLDEDGFLSDATAWNQTVAEQLAASEGVTLSAEHWLLIHLARDYYREYAVAPGMRILVALLRRHYAQQTTASDLMPPGNNTSPPRIDSRYLYRLFSDSPGRQVCRYAGLPKPVSCI